MLCKMLSEFPQPVLPLPRNVSTVWHHCDLINTLLIWQTGSSTCIWVHRVKAKSRQFGHRVHPVF